MVFILMTGLYVFAGAMMAKMRLTTVMVAIIFAAMGCHLATDSGIPFWRDHPAGDAYDLAVLIYFIVCYCGRDR